jgi:hypothetical protein
MGAALADANLAAGSGTAAAINGSRLETRASPSNTNT